MHAPMAKSVELNDMPEDIDQYTKVVESRTRGIELMVQIRAEALGNGDGIRMLTREDKRDLLEAWEDLQVRAEDGGNSSKIADLEQECDRLKGALSLEEEFHSETQRILVKAEKDRDTYKGYWDSACVDRDRFAKEATRSFESEMNTKAKLKDANRELSVLRRALNAANGVIGHFTGRK